MIVFEYIFRFFAAMRRWGVRRLDWWRYPSLTVGDPPQKVRVHCSSEVKSRAQFMKNAHELLETLGKNIRIHSYRGRGNSVQPIDDGDFHVHIWSTPIEKGLRSLPDRIAGKAFDGYKSGFVWSGTGIPIISDRNIVVGELVDSNNLYMLLDVDFKVSFSFMEPWVLFRSILETGIKHATRSAAWRERTLAKYLKQVGDNHRKRFFKAVAGDLFAEITSAEELAAGAGSKLDRTHSTLVSKLQELKEAEEMLRVLGDVERKENERFAEEFDELFDLESVRSFSVSSNMLVLNTEMLRCAHPVTQRVHEIGEFRIEIYLDGSRGGVRWFNMTNPRVVRNGGRMQAPLVREDGSSLSLKDTEIFVDLIMERSYPIVASLAVQFIESPDPEAMGIDYISTWPVAEGVAA